MAKSTSKKNPIELEDLVTTSGSATLELDDLLDDSDDSIVLESDVEAEEPEIEVEIKTTTKTSKATKKVTSTKPEICEFITDVAENIEHLTWLLYGKNGTGKTTIGGTADGALILAAEDGTLSIRNSKNNIKKLPIDVWDKVEQAYWLLKNGVVTSDGIKIHVKGGTFLVKTLVIDTITRLIQICLRSVVLGEAAKDPEKDVVSPTLRDWGTMSQKLAYWLMQFDELPVQKVWLMQETTSTDPTEDEVDITVDANKAMRNMLLSQADIIGRTCLIKHDGQTKFAVKFAPNTNFVTKDRTGVLGKTFVNPNLDNLYSRVFKEA